MSPRPKVEHLRKPQIISAAAEVLYERGLFDTRIGDIAERAGTSAPTILYYFESKDRLLDYTAQGKRSYYLASTFEQEPYREEAPVLRRLSSEFELCAYGLNQVRREWEKQRGPTIH